MRSKEELGHALREKRPALRLTQGDVARKSGLRQKTVSDVEQGRGLSGATPDLELKDRRAADLEPEEF